MSKASARKKPVPRTRPHAITFWLSTKEKAALDEAVAVLEGRSGKSRQCGEHLRGAVARFVREVKMSQDFE